MHPILLFGFGLAIGGIGYYSFHKMKTNQGILISKSLLSAQHVAHGKSSHSQSEHEQQQHQQTAHPSQQKHQAQHHTTAASHPRNIARNHARTAHISPIRHAQHDPDVPEKHLTGGLDRPYSQKEIRHFVPVHDETNQLAGDVVARTPHIVRGDIPGDILNGHKFDRLSDSSNSEVETYNNMVRHMNDPTSHRVDPHVVNDPIEATKLGYHYGTFHQNYIQLGRNNPPINIGGGNTGNA